MTSTFLQNVFSNWHPMRWIALAAGVFLGVQAVWHRDGLAGLLAIFFLLQAITNSGCFGVQGCAPPVGKKPNNTESDKLKEVEFTEIKE